MVPPFLFLLLRMVQMVLLLARVVRMAGSQGLKQLQLVPCPWQCCWGMGWQAQRVPHLPTAALRRRLLHLLLVLVLP